MPDKPEIGLQLWSVRNSLENDYLATLEKITEIGYHNLELITKVTPDGLVFGKSMRAPELRSQLDRLGLRAVSCHFVPEAGMSLEKILADLHVLGVESLVCAIAFFASLTEVTEFIHRFNRYGETCKRHGIRLYYHNHYHEFQLLNGKSIFERMCDQMDQDLVGFELDTYWVVRGGQDPIYWLKKLGKRGDLLHQKDLPTGVTPVNLLEQLAPGSSVLPESMAGTQEADKFAEIGEGQLNIAGFIQAALEYNHPRYIFVEQDMSKRSELESIAVSYKNLERLLAEA